MKRKFFVVSALMLMSKIAWGEGYGYNPHGAYPNPYSPYSMANPYSTSAPQLYGTPPNAASYAYGHHANPYSANSASIPYKAGNPYTPYTTPNPHTTGGNPYSQDNISEPYGNYDNPTNTQSTLNAAGLSNVTTTSGTNSILYNANSATNTSVTGTAQLYDNQGNFLGTINNPNDPGSLVTQYSKSTVINTTSQNSVTTSSGANTLLNYQNTATNIPVTGAVQIYDNQGNYVGTVNNLDPNSLSVPYGFYNAPYSPDLSNNTSGIDFSNNPDISQIMFYGQ